jgi:hypothetical protein
MARLRLREQTTILAGVVDRSMQGVLPSWIGPLVIATNLVLASLVTVGVARAARSAGFDARRRRRLVGATVVVLGAWLTLAAVVARASLDPLHPETLGAIFGPVLLGVGLVGVSSTWRRLLAAVPQTWLVGGQFYRVIGAVFLVGWGAGVLPAYFALPAGVGDIVTGGAALVVAGLLARGVDATRTVLGWNAFGLLDLVVAVSAGSGLLVAPLVAVFGDSGGVTTAAVVGWPLGLVPFFLVPISTLLHVYSVAKAVERRRVPLGASQPAT